MVAASDKLAELGTPAGGGWGVAQLTVRYGRRLALQDVDLDLPRGQITAVVGGDGAGKSTLLRALAGVVRPTAGRVHRPPARRIGYVSAATGVYHDLTAAQNLAFAGSAYGLGGAELRARAVELLAATGLAPAADRLAGQLSGGMRQKLAFAMAVLHRPDLLILDEPTTGVDPVSRAELWRLVAGQAAAGAAVLFSTTYIDEAERAVVVLVLESGSPLLQGSPEALTAALPGAVFALPAEAATARPAPDRSWRRGRVWHVWAPDGAVPASADPLAADLSDAVIVAALVARTELAKARHE
jgi:ABC-2 type transport system ATP-binding protein